jgi:hypothetical protein
MCLEKGDDPRVRELLLVQSLLRSLIGKLIKDPRDKVIMISHDPTNRTIYFHVDSHTKNEHVRFLGGQLHHFSNSVDCGRIFECVASDAFRKEFFDTDYVPEARSIYGRYFGKRKG